MAFLLCTKASLMQANKLYFHEQKCIEIAINNSKRFLSKKAKFEVLSSRDNGKAKYIV